jgi:5-methylcytosine-specific restriction endonuclease McrA
MHFEKSDSHPRWESKWGYRMRALDKPSFALADVVEACLPSTNPPRDITIRQGLPALQRSESDYQECGEQAELFKVTVPDKTSLSAAEKEMPWLYEKKFCTKNGPARNFYDQIISSAPHRLCPLCAQRDVSTIDHYLPKSAYPGFAVTPLNLIPACKDCNHNKLDDYANEQENQTFHPYFDNFDDAQWLMAEIFHKGGFVIQYSVARPTNCNKVTEARLRLHFDKFELAKLYASNAMREVAGICDRLNRLADCAGSDGVRTELQTSASSWRKAAKNSWQAALYTALAASEWFCSGGHRDVGK